MPDPTDPTTEYARDGWAAFHRVGGSFRAYRVVVRQLMRAERALWFAIGFGAGAVCIKIMEALRDA